MGGCVHGHVLFVYTISKTVKFAKYEEISNLFGFLV